MHKYGTAAAALIAATVPLMSVVPTAHADLLGASIRHHDPDTGYHRAFKVRYKNGDTALLGVGDHSDHHEPNGDEYVTNVHARKGEEIWCGRIGAGWFFLTGHGWSRDLNYDENWECVVRFVG